MDRSILYVYHRDKFQDFYNSSKDILAASYILYSNLTWDDLDWDEINFLDITSLTKLAASRAELLFHLELFIKTVLENEVKIVIEETSASLALELFYLYFSTIEYVTQEQKSPGNVEKPRGLSLKDVFLFRGERLKAIKEDREQLKVEVIPFSQVIQGENGIEGLDKRQIYDIDITAAVKQVKFRPELILNYEMIIRRLSTYDNIFFILDEYLTTDCSSLFPHSFNKYIQVDENIMGHNNVETKSKPIVEYSSEDFDELFISIERQLFGHKDFKDDLKSQLKAFNILYKLGHKRIMSIFICGESGLGKTEVARLLHKHTSPNENPIKINFGNYSGRGSLWSLIGSPKGYFGSGEGGELSNKLLKSNTKIILIDEFEKADEAIFNFFYELLEDGKFTDLMGNEVDLNGYIIFFTSNLTESNYNSVIPNALLSRFDMKYEFTSLSPLEKQQFVEYQVEHLVSALEFKFTIPEGLINKDLLLDVNIDNMDNLREIKTEIDKKFMQTVAPLLPGLHPK